MALGLPDLSGVIAATSNMPEQFEQLISRLDSVVTLLEEQNELLRTGVMRHEP